MRNEVVRLIRTILIILLGVVASVLFGYLLWLSAETQRRYQPDEPESTKVYLDICIITGYCSCRTCCGDFADSITASGKNVEEISGRFVAAQPLKPFGRILFIESVGLVSVEDRGSAIHGKRLDLFFNTHQAALEFGVKELHVWRLK